MIKKVSILITIKIFTIVILLNHFKLSVSMKCFLSLGLIFLFRSHPPLCSLFCSKFLFSLEKLCLHCLKSPTLPVCLFSSFSVSRKLLSSRDHETRKYLISVSQDYDSGDIDFDFSVIEDFKGTGNVWW